MSEIITSEIPSPVASGQWSVASTSPLATRGVPTTRLAVQAKLLHHLELAFGGSPVPSHPLPKHHSYLIRVISIHFKLQWKPAEEAVLTSATLGELSDRIADLLNLPREQLF